MMHDTKSDGSRSETDLAREMPLMCPQASEAGSFAFELHEVWTMQYDEAIEAVPKNEVSLSDLIDRNRADGVHGEEMRSDSLMQFFVIPPDRVFILAWQLAGIFFIAWDAIFLPMQPFELPGYSFREGINNITMFFWASDMCLSFFVGYWNDTYMELRPGPVAWQYFTGWFTMDCSLVLLDIVVTLTTTGTWGMLSIARSLKTVRLLRIARVFRLLRLAKVSSHFDHMTDWLTSEDLVTTIRITKMVLAVLALSHFVACAWYAIGDLLAENSWVGHLHTDDRAVESQSWVYLYSTALHWSLTQFTPGSMEVVPVNELERIFTIVVIVIALIICSSILSTITAAMTHLRIMKTEQYEQSHHMRTYLKQNTVSIRLSTSIQKFLRSHKQRGRKFLHEPDVHLFTDLPDSLRILLRVEVRLPSLLAHPLFQKISKDCPSSTKEICDACVQERTACKGDKIFSHGNRGKCMYFVRSGELKYKTLSEGFDVRCGDFVAEQPLWVKWKHRGHFVAVGKAELFTVGAEGFHDIIGRSLVHTPCCYYARQYINLLRASGGEFGITDMVDKNRVTQFVQVAWREGICHVTRSGSALDLILDSWSRSFNLQMRR